MLLTIVSAEQGTNGLEEFKGDHNSHYKVGSEFDF